MLFAIGEHSPSRSGDAPVMAGIGALLKISKTVISGALNPSMIQTRRNSSFTVNVTFTYLEGALADHLPVTLILNPHFASLAVKVSAPSGSWNIGDLETWDTPSLILHSNVTLSALLTIYIPSDFPLGTRFIPPLFAFQPSVLVYLYIPSLEVSVI